MHEESSLSQSNRQLKYDYYRLMHFLSANLRHLRHDIIDHISVIQALEVLDRQVPQQQEQIAYKNRLLSHCQKLQDVLTDPLFHDFPQTQIDYRENLLGFHQDGTDIIEKAQLLCNILPKNGPEEMEHSSDLERACLASCDALLSRIVNGNTIAETLLYDQKRQGLLLGIDFRLDIKAFPKLEDMNFSEIELFELLDNLICNATEAACTVNNDSPANHYETTKNSVILSAGSFVSLTSIIKDNTWLITITNSKRADKKHQALSDKIIQQIVAAHDGTMETRSYKYTSELVVSLPVKEK